MTWISFHETLSNLWRAKPKNISAVQSSAGARCDKAKHPPVQKTTPTPVALPRQ